MIEQASEKEMPPGWTVIRLGDAADYLNGRAFKSSDWEEEGLPIIRIQNLNNPDAPFNYSTSDFEERYRVEDGDLLFAWSASLGAHIWHGGLAWLNQHIFKVVASPAVAQKYLYYFLKSIVAELYAETHGSGMVHITKKKFDAIPIQLPPHNEQRRIVAKIEELLSELDKGIESLQTARAQLKTYRQSLLKAAFEGRLTEQWRRENADKLEPADQFLARIRKEREARYQQQLEDWKAAVEKWEAEGKPVKKPTKPSLPKVEATDASDDVEDQFSLLPDSWAWIRLGNAAVESVLGKMLDKKKNRGILKPYLRNINVRWGRFDLDDLLEMRFEGHEQNRYGLADGDLVICEGGEPGRCAVWKDSFSDDMRIQKALHRVRFPKNSVLPQYVQIYLEYAAMTQRLEGYMTGTTIKHLTGKGVNRVSIPICSVEEQELILDSLSERFTNIDHAEKNIDITLQQAETLRQSILKRAFEGKLVPQDPDDEPATELLARIRAEEENRKSERTRKKRRQKA